MKSIFIFFILFLASQHILTAQTIPLYPDSIPNSRPSPNEETIENKDGMIGKISVPALYLFPALLEKANGTAVIICPGGGYWAEFMNHEGRDEARALNEMGVSAFILKYRIPNDQTMIDRTTGPLMDAQQAIKMVRLHAAEWHIDPQRVGIMGFSAGGHLASTAGTHFKSVLIPDPEHISVRPDFMILIYPVISFQDSIGHIGSRDQLIGKNPTTEKKDLYSNELQVTDETPPAFLVHASDDDGVKPDNSILFYQALLRHHVPAELHLYESGGHGFGMHFKNTQELWMDRCKNWLLLNGWLKKSVIAFP